ncbi:hypothetical protein DFH08DRAFT_865430 [Mycena albidolilacea]|uniref:Secreted protein n=1 Tax=Mycena albidolilacea TaxID=1033008 RepID=A0AAD7ET97_9AGAR|nr:hypothetical protein DFH08DRAFT_865430 [Mycena albidolilacea]
MPLINLVSAWLTAVWMTHFAVVEVARGFQALVFFSVAVEIGGGGADDGAAVDAGTGVSFAKRVELSTGADDGAVVDAGAGVGVGPRAESSAGADDGAAVDAGAG